MPAKTKLYKHAPELAKGTEVRDFKDIYIIDEIIGRGGFGIVYSARVRCGVHLSTPHSLTHLQRRNDSTDYAIKVERIDNGPLFCETKTYMRALKRDLLTAFKELHSWFISYRHGHMELQTYRISLCQHSLAAVRFSRTMLICAF
jgi:hypothetical protein